MTWTPPVEEDKRQEILQRIADGEPVSKIVYEENVSESTIRRWRRKVGNVSNPTSNAFTANLTAKTQINSLQGINIAAICDMQVKPNVDLSYVSHTGQYLAHKKPKVIVCGGDFADMPSLNNYDLAGSMGMEGQRYREDILSVQTAMNMLMKPIKEEMAATGWNPRLVFIMGNHEYRIERAIKATPKLEGVISLADLGYEDHGWEVIPFLQPIVIEGVAFCHYFCSGVMGKPITTARALLTKKHMSCFAFHQQGRDIAFGTRGDGKQIIGIIAGSCYPHDEGYLNHQTNNHWRGMYMLNDVVDGEFEEMAVSLKFLAREYGK